MSPGRDEMPGATARAVWINPMKTMEISALAQPVLKTGLAERQA